MAVRGPTISCAFLFPMASAVCPICNTETGEQGRAGIFGSDFWTTLLAIASLFPVLLLAIAAYHFEWLKVGRHFEKQPMTPAPKNPISP